jgi:hypothetical protein
MRSGWLRRTFGRESACRICAGHPLHRLWCPELRRTLDLLTFLLTVATVLLVAFGKSPGNGWPLAAVLLALSWAGSIASRVASWRRLVAQRQET